MPSITIVVPAHNEERNVPLMYEAVSRVMAGVNDTEWNLLYVDDGSTDGTLQSMKQLAATVPHVQYIELSRNFGKEIATTAGLHYAKGDAVILMDADLQHPPELIPVFLETWQKDGTDMVVGLRRKNVGEGWVKKWGSYFFNNVFRRFFHTEMQSNETDFRLISRPMLESFRDFTERERMTRGLLNWLGFKRSYVIFDAAERVHGEASYSTMKLMRLALYSLIVNSPLPLQLVGWAGWIAMLGGGFTFAFMLLDRYVIHDPWNFNFSGPAMLAMLMTFIMGIILLCVRLVAWYVENIHTEALNRPLYVVRERKI